MEPAVWLRRGTSQGLCPVPCAHSGVLSSRLHCVVSSSQSLRSVSPDSRHVPGVYYGMLFFLVSTWEARCGRAVCSTEGVSPVDVWVLHYTGWPEQFCPECWVTKTLMPLWLGISLGSQRKKTIFQVKYLDKATLILIKRVRPEDQTRKDRKCMQALFQPNGGCVLSPLTGVQPLILSLSFSLPFLPASSFSLSLFFPPSFFSIFSLAFELFESQNNPKNCAF